jgi:uncharacterized repeat protein (TIGR01451 family)
MLSTSERPGSEAAGSHRRSWIAVAGAVLTVAVGLTFAGGQAFADPSSPISVTKTATPSPVASGQQLTYTIQLVNTGGAKVNNVVLTDQVNGVGVIQSPPALPQLIITSSKGVCTQGGPNGNLVTCNVGTMNGNESATVTIRGQVTAPSGTTLNNTASVTGTKSAQTFTTTGTVSVLVSGGTGGGNLPDLTINKTGPTSVALATPMTYTLTMNNVGTANTANVRVVDTLPPGVTLAATNTFETTSLFGCSHNAPANPITVICTGGAVNQGQNATIKINAISPIASPPTQITNTAVVDPDNTIEESNELNNTSATVNTTLGGPPAAPLLSIKKTDGNPDLGVPWDTGAGPDPVNPGEELVYKIQVVNNATSRADDVRVSDTTQSLEASSIIASQVIVDGALGVGRGCVVNAPEVICSIKSLNAGGTLTVTIRGIVVGAAGSNIFNTATVHGNIKNVGVTNTSTESTTIRPSIDLTITKADRPDPACARTWPTTNPDQHLANPPDGLGAATGDIPAVGLLATPVCLGGLIYDFVIGNSGNGDATNVTVRDPLPAGLIFDSYESTAGFVCSVNASNVVTCNGGAIAAADTETLTFMLVAPPTVGSITNSVSVDPNNAIFEPDETNNTDTETTTISTGVDLVVWKGDDTFDTADSDPNDEDPPGGAPPLDEGFDPIATNGTQTYTVIVDNVGTQDVTGIKVRDVLPAGTRFLSFSATNGFTCTHDGSTFGGNVTCIGGHLLGTAAEFYQRPGTPPPLAPGDDRATIKIKVFATPFVQPIMHNEVRVDPDGEIAEVNEVNNFAFQNTFVGVGNDDRGAFNQLTIDKTQVDPSDAAGDPDATVAQNGVVVYDLEVSNLGTDPVSAIVVKDFLPTGSRFISASDTDVGTSLSDAFFCFHDGSATGGTVTCIGGDLSGSVNSIPDGLGVVPTVRNIRVKIFAPNTPGTYPNIVVVDPDNIVVEGNEFDNDDAVLTTVTVGGNNMFNELTIDKTQTDPLGNAVATSSIVTWEIDVSNTGSDPAFNVALTDTLPSGFTFISAHDTSGPADPFRFVCVPGPGNTVNCTGATLSGTVNAAGTNPTSRTIVLRAFSSAIPGEYTNTAIVDPGNAIPEGNETNNSASELTTVSNGGPGPFIDLTIDKSGDLTATPGGPLNYSLVVSNVGAATAFNVTVLDVLPAGVTFINAADSVVGPDPNKFTCSYAAPNLTCTGGTLPSGGSRTINIHAVAPSNLEELVDDQENISVTVSNQAFVDPLNAIAEGNEANNHDSVNTVVSSPINLSLTKEGPGSVTQNDTTTYTITVTNNKIGPTGATAFGVKIVDPLPIGLIPLNVVADPGNFACQIQENPVNFITCIGDLETTQSVTITITAFVTANGGTLDNEACVDPDHVIDETNELDNCKHVIGQVVTPKPDLQVTKTADSSVANIGQELQYTVSVSNVGDADTTDTVTMTDILPADVTLVSPGGVTAPAGWTCSGTTTITCDNTSGMTQGENAQFTIRVTVDATASGTIKNEAFVNQVTDETNAANNSTSLTTSVGGSGVDLTIANIVDSPDPVNARPSQLTYIVIGQNNGAAAANGVKISLDLPDSGISSPVAAGSNGFNCDPVVAGTIECTGDLPGGGGNTTITVVMTVDAGAPNDLVLEATIDPSNAFGESDETNNVEEETTTVTGDVCTSSPCFDIAVADIDASAQTVTAGNPVTFTVSVVNLGDSPIDPIALWDMHFQWTGTAASMSVAGPGGITCANFPAMSLDPLHQHCQSTALVDAMDLGPGLGTTFTVTVTPSSAGTGQLEVIADIFNAISGEFDETNNNTATEVIDVNP